jgi:pimeloyl-ACP methyl ester carboxylesterase
MAHSLGCAPAALYASHHAERVKGLILIEPMVDVHAFWTRGETSKSIWSEKAAAGRRNGWTSIGELKSRIEQNRATRAWAPEVLEDILREETRLFPDGHVEIKWHQSIYNLDEMWEDRTSILDEAPRIVMPTLVLARADNPQLESRLKPLANALPQGKIEVLAGLGHAMYMENPGLIADIARRFLT